ncbi:MAG: flagellar biosynthesis anti-sigma factor FlgM [Desulfobacteraceae bacterium]|nr:flagellar biosynthesis anti-sigma factor FlgM [Desulfobacteraceae bacterium]
MNQKKTEKPGIPMDFSRTSDEFNKAAVMMEKMPAERIEKVNEIKRKIMDGTYHVDPEKIAEKILKNIQKNPFHGLWDIIQAGVHLAASPQRFLPD